MNNYDQDVYGHLPTTSTTTTTFCRVMATENVSEHGKQDTFLLKGLYCSTDIAAGIHIQLTFIVILNIFLSITAFLENSLILFTLHKELSLHPPSKLLLRNLAITDLCVGLIVEPLYVTLLLTAVNEHWSTCRSLEVAVSMISSILSAVSLLTMTAISVDRLLALLLGLRYRQVVTLKRVFLITIIFYIVSIASAIIRIFWNSLIASWYDILCVSLCLVVSTFCYTKIFFTLRSHHQHQVQDHIHQPNQANQLNIARYRKAVSTALWLQVTLIACYLPYSLLIPFVIHAEPSLSVSLAWSYTLTLLYLNSSLNPILYCWKLDEVRQAVKDKIRQVLCC